MQRKLLTILFGQSGLGKTSILRAGIVPRLRPEGYCPVYVRIDYSPESPDAVRADQAGDLPRDAGARAQWTQTGVAVSGESLWEFLHHRDDVLRDASGKTLIPLLIFDQFEEIFTLAQSDDFGRKRAAQFLEDLADLVENRAPKALEARIEQDESAAERFDFTRGDYRILIALREDYLAHLEGVKGMMPSITQNRMRLARMTGAQALAAVLKPGGKLVSEEVAESIVRFIAGGSELRQRRGRAVAALAHLPRAQQRPHRAGPHRDLRRSARRLARHDPHRVLRARARRPAARRAPVHRGRDAHRVRLSREPGRGARAQGVRRGGRAAGHAGDARRPAAAAHRGAARRAPRRAHARRAVQRRAASRDLRLEREARDEAERKLAAQRERERATRKALVRARQIAAGCAVLAVVAIGSAIFGYVSMKRAQDAEAKAEQTRADGRGRARRSRKADRLPARRLLPRARAGRPARHRRRAREARDRLLQGAAPELRTPDTERNHALALIRLGGVANAQGKIDEAGASIESAARMIEELRAQGDDSDATRLAMAYARVAQGEVLSSQANSTAAAQKYRDALELLKSITAQSAESKKAAALEGQAYLGLGSAELRTWDDGSGGQHHLRDAEQHLTRAQEIARTMNALDLASLPASALYLQAGERLARTLYEEGKYSEAAEVANATKALADRVLQLRPDYRPALLAAAYGARVLADIDYNNNGRVAAALKHYQESRAALEKLLALDPSKAEVWVRLAVVNVFIAYTLRDLGRMQEAVQAWQDTIAMADKSTLTPSTARSFAFWSGQLAVAHQNMGDAMRAEAALEKRRKFAALGISGSNTDLLLPEDVASVEATVMRIAGKHAESRAHAQQALDRLREGRGKLPPFAPLERRLLGDVQQASYAMGDYVAAEAAARQRMTIFKQQVPATIFTEFYYLASVVSAAKAMARQGRQTEALELLKPALEFHRHKRWEKSEDLEIRVYKCDALLAAALADPAMRKTYLTEAARLFDNMPPEARRWRSYAVIREEIAREMAR